MAIVPPAVALMVTSPPVPVPKFSPAIPMPTAKRLIAPLLVMVELFVAVTATSFARALPVCPLVPLGLRAVPACADAFSVIAVNCALTPPSTVSVAVPPSASPPRAFSLPLALPPTPSALAPRAPNEMVEAASVLIRTSAVPPVPVPPFWVKKPAILPPPVPPA